ncbi:MAG: oligosaccharide flippase family protein [Burkholderiales bacterium]|nr:oligosaccharide flippase family protein [Burkholderiales bacterium]
MTAPIHSPSHGLARNAGWNLLGAALPLPVALLCIPLLVAALGVDRFGVLGLAWVVMGYFGMFDFGLGQSTTRLVAQRKASQDLRTLMLNSLLLHAALGLLGGAAFAALVPWLATRAFEVPPELVGETTHALYWLAASVPAIVISAALRGMLEGLHRFDIVNLVRIPAGIVNFAGPVIALQFADGLPAAVAVIAVARFVVVLAYAAACLRLLPAKTGTTRIEGALLRRLASYGGWLTVSNFVNPLIIVTDRFVVAAAVSVAAVAYYVTPYEVITKTWIISASVLGALFPVLSAAAADKPAALRGICRQAETVLLCLAAPVVAVLLAGSDLLLELWLGTSFREQSTVVAQLLAIGILVNVVAQVPLTALNASGRADLSAKIAAVELPLYVVAIWYGAHAWGINGVAAVWALRAAIDAVLLSAAAHATLPPGDAGAPRGLTAVNLLLLGGFLLAFWLIGMLLPGSWLLRAMLVGTLLAALLVWEWHRVLNADDRKTILALYARLAGKSAA